MSASAGAAVIFAARWSNWRRSIAGGHHAGPTRRPLAFPDRARSRPSAAPRPRGSPPPVARRDRDPRDHRLSRTRQPRRDRGDSRRRHLQGDAGRVDGGRWVRPAGRREVPGRPLIYATTPAFLQHFGLTSRRDLPGLEDLRARRAARSGRSRAGADGRRGYCPMVKRIRTGRRRLSAFLCVMATSQCGPRLQHPRSGAMSSLDHCRWPIALAMPKPR